MEFRERSQIPETHPNVVESFSQKTAEEYRDTFGGKILASKDRLNDFVSQDAPPIFIERERKILARHVETVRTLLQQNATNNLPAVARMMEMTINYCPELQTALTAHSQNLIEEQNGKVDPLVFTDPEFIASLPNDLFEKLIIEHRKAMQEQEERTKEMSFWLLPELLKKIKDLVIAKDLPISTETIERKLKHLKISVTDELTSHLENSSGAYDAETHTIFINESFLDQRELFKKVLAHELFHALSGQTWNQIKLSPTSKNQFVNNSRVGLDFNLSRSLFSNNRFSWMNEAMTENLARLICDVPHDEKTVYESERDLLQILQTKGRKPISTNLFHKAYFAGLEEAPCRMEAWRELSAQFREAFADGFLVKLDNYILQFGIKQACATMKLDWHLIMLSKRKSKK